MAKVQPLNPGALYQHTDLENISFDTTEDLKYLEEAIGQPRAIEAVRFGVGIEQEGYNIFAMGPTGMGKRDLVEKHFRLQASGEPIPPDWCYVYNFDQPHRPNALSLPPGKGREFEKDMNEFTEEMRSALSGAFESEEYRTRRQVIEQEFQEKQENRLEELQKKAQQEGFALIRTPAGLVFAPSRDGEVISPEEFQTMEEEQRAEMQQKLEGLQEELKVILQDAPRAQREVRDRMRELHQEITTYAVGGLIDELQEKYSEFPEIVEFLEEVQEDVVENAEMFLAAEQDGEGGQANIMSALMGRPGLGQQVSSHVKRYQVNLLIDNSEQEGAPIIFEDYPTYQNLVGRVEHRAQMGALTTDFSLIKPGSLHRANGGYLIIDARTVLQQPYAWEGLKRALRGREVKIESLGQIYSVISTVSLEPEPIPLEVKVALLGDRTLYYLLSMYDPEFDEFFKVQADFEEQMDRDQQHQQEYARMIATVIHDNKLKLFDREAVARVMEHSARMVGDKEKLSAHIRDISDLLREADYWARQNGHDDTVRREDVQKAIDAQIFRADRLRERVQESILRKTFLIDTEGAVVGQVNGLSVITLSGFAFGRPSRITARVRMGKGEVVDIEREVELSGPIHSKGVLILSGFLGARYARDEPLSLSASLVFEQSYGGVDGDSASSAELYALLSAISEVPIHQNFAVTGAINQRGEVQAIGGVNEKIEGFFDICKARGLTGDQGVLIPEANVKHLMLREDVIEAVRDGKFSIYPITNVDEGIELLTGTPAGEPDEEGRYPEDTINGRVQKRLAELAEKRRRLAEESKEQTR